MLFKSMGFSDITQGDGRMEGIQKRMWHMSEDPGPFQHSRVKAKEEAGPES